MSKGSPKVSVLMPTFKQATFIRRALESVRAQTMTDWELVIVDDGSPDNTHELVQRYLHDPRIRYHRLAYNGGLGAALNLATRLAGGQYLAYLPSDDLFYPDHLARLVALLDTRPEVYLSYGGVHWGEAAPQPTLQGKEAVGREAEVLATPPAVPKTAPLPSGNILALVQVAHRRRLEQQVRWTERGEQVSDTLEPDYWRALLARGAHFAYTGATTCAWVEHPDQRHIIIAGHPGGLARYRSYYGIGLGEFINWQPSYGSRIDERARYARFAIPRDLPTPGGLKILLVGELGFHAERIVALEEHGHKLYGLWIPRPEVWDTANPLAYGNIEYLPYDDMWRDRVREIKPDVIYALLNWQALELIHEVVEAKLPVPLVFHFKEGPMLLPKLGLWPAFVRILQQSDGQIFINEESRAWVQLATDGLLDPATTFILDGDLPKRDWFTTDWSPKLSAQDGAIHTVCAGRPLGLSPFEEIAAAGIHVHFYGSHFQQWFPNWSRDSAMTGFMHAHPTVEPEDWVRELSRYDAAWFHVFDSENGGDLRRAIWDDLNFAARLGTYAAAGLPWIMKDNSHSTVALQRLARQHDVGFFFTDFADLGKQLRDREHLARVTTNMRAARHLFAFDTHVEALIDFFRQAMDRYDSGTTSPY